MLHLESADYITLRPLLPVNLTSFTFSWMRFILNRLLLMDSVDSDVVQKSTLSESIIVGCWSAIHVWSVGYAWLVSFHHLFLQLFKFHRGCRQVKPVVVVLLVAYFKLLVIDSVAPRSGQSGVCPSPIVVWLRWLAHTVLIWVLLNRPDDVFWGAVICLFQFFA